MYAFIKRTTFLLLSTVIVLLTWIAHTTENITARGNQPCYKHTYTDIFAKHRRATYIKWNQTEKRINKLNETRESKTLLKKKSNYSRALIERKKMQTFEWVTVDGRWCAVERWMCTYLYMAMCIEQNIIVNQAKWWLCNQPALQNYGKWKRI